MSNFNLADVFFELRKRYPAREILERLGKSETTQEYIFIVSSGGCGKNRMVDRREVFTDGDTYKRALHEYFGYNVPVDMVLGDFTMRKIHLSEYSLTGLALRVLEELKLTSEDLVNKLQRECLNTLIGNGSNPADVYMEVYTFLEGLLPE